MEYTSLNNLMGLDSAMSESYLKDMISKVQKISAFIKRIPIVEDQAYYTSRSEEYKKLLKQAKQKLGKLLQKIFLYTHGKQVEIEE
jgi:hypothetical protein